jgi:CheY-like chemotaxis protein
MKRILLVNVQMETKDFLSKLFFSNGYVVETAQDNEMAMKVVRRKKYNLVIADFIMPIMDGLRLTRELKSYCPSLPVLILSGCNLGEALCRAAGADAFVTKPINLSDIKTVVEKILDSKK